MKRKSTLRMLAVALCIGAAGEWATAQNADVYAVGYEKNDDSKNVAKVWKNATLLYNLTDGTRNAYPQAIHVSGNDVYTVGYEMSANGKYVGKVWKNSAELYVFGDGFREAIAYDLHVSGSDVYAAGYELNANGNAVAKVWKNNAVLYNLTNGNQKAYIHSMYVFNDDIYVCGQNTNGYGTLRGTVWKNGSQLFTFGPSAGTQSSNALDICVSGNYVYVSGNIDPSYAYIYRYNNGNGTVDNGYYQYEATGRTNPYAYAYSIDIESNDLYVAVSSTIDKVYKNGNELYDMGSGKISDISVQSRNVYIAGYELDTAKVWKNGEQLYVLTDGTKTARASGIFVVSGGTGIKEVSADNAKIIGYYSITGQKLAEEPQSGLYIIQYDNGTAEKKLKTGN
jgi:hypothetical protein